MLRSVERVGDEAVQLAEASDLERAMEQGPAAIDAWLAQRAQHVPSTRLQLFDANGAPVFDRVIGGADRRFEGIRVTAEDPAVAAGRSWTRGVSVELVGDRVVVRAISPVDGRAPRHEGRARAVDAARR